MLYSLNKSYPKPKPSSITLPDGSVLTGDDVTEEVLLEAGYVAIPDYPLNDGRYKQLMWTGTGWGLPNGEYAFPKPFDSWVLNETYGAYEAPVALPEDAGIDGLPKRYVWDEETTSWVEVEE